MGPNPITFPSAEAVTDALREVATSPYVDLTDGADCDVRLQVYPSGAWAIRYGLSDYDQDHRGFWGASVIDAETNLTRTAQDLIDQAREDAACAGYGDDCDCCPEGVHKT